MRRALAASALLVATGAGAASFSPGARGTTALPFLGLGAGARAEALGGAYSAAADGADALYWNPAGLAALPGGEATFMHAPYIDSSFYDYAAAAHRAGPGALAVGLQYFSAGGVDETDLNGAVTGTAKPYDASVSVGYGLALPEDGPLGGTAVGLAAKFIRSRLATTASAAAADLGVRSPALADGRLRLALAARNLGGSIKYDAVSEDLPLAVSLAASWKLGAGWLAVAQADLPRGAGPSGAAGAEYRRAAGDRAELAARVGFDSRALGELSGLAGVTAGAGIAFSGLAFDYAFVPLGDLGLTHRLSVTWRWGPGVAPEREEARRAEPAAKPAPAPAAAPEPAPAAAPEAGFEAREFAARGAESVKDFAKAAQEWRAAEALLPPDDERRVYVQVRLGEVATREGDMQEATARYLVAIAFAKARGLSGRPVVAAYAGLADRLAAKGRNDDALRNYRKALTLTEDDALKARVQRRIDALSRPAAEPASEER